MISTCASLAKKAPLARRAWKAQAPLSSSIEEFYQKLLCTPHVLPKPGTSLGLHSVGHNEILQPKPFGDSIPLLTFVRETAKLFSFLALLARLLSLAAMAAAVSEVPSHQGGAAHPCYNGLEGFLEFSAAWPLQHATGKGLPQALRWQGQALPEQSHSFGGSAHGELQPQSSPRFGL